MTATRDGIFRVHPFFIGNLSIRDCGPRCIFRRFLTIALLFCQRRLLYKKVQPAVASSTGKNRHQAQNRIQYHQLPVSGTFLTRFRRPFLSKNRHKLQHLLFFCQTLSNFAKIRPLRNRCFSSRTLRLNPNAPVDEVSQTCLPSLTGPPF